MFKTEGFLENGNLSVGLNFVSEHDGVTQYSTVYTLVGTCSLMGGWLATGKLEFIEFIEEIIKERKENETLIEKAKRYPTSLEDSARQQVERENEENAISNFENKVEVEKHRIREGNPELSLEEVQKLANQQAKEELGYDVEYIPLGGDPLWLSGGFRWKTLRTTKHTINGHVDRAKKPHKSKYKKPAQLKKLQIGTVKSPDRTIDQGDRIRFEKDYKRVIGTEGQKSHVVVVMKKTGQVRTSFPHNPQG